MSGAQRSRAALENLTMSVKWDNDHRVARHWFSVLFPLRHGWRIRTLFLQNYTNSASRYCWPACPAGWGWVETSVMVRILMQKEHPRLERTQFAEEPWERKQSDKGNRTHFTNLRKLILWAWQTVRYDHYDLEQLKMTWLSGKMCHQHSTAAMWLQRPW